MRVLIKAVQNCLGRSNFYQDLKLLSVKHSEIDYSKVPSLGEQDLEENFIRGSGPGGSNVNKNSNCVQLIHKPTGIVVKCHQSRLLHKNRELARAMLVTKLDNLINGSSSVESQISLIKEQSSIKMESRKKRLREMKDKWKEKEGFSRDTKM